MPLRAELTPEGFPSGDSGLPARALSFRQARTIAALLGAHLPSREEFLLAANAGLADLDYPWGTGFEPGRIVADPDYLREPRSVGSHTDGASPLGVLHLLGNVAEYLSTGPSGEVLLAGGHYQTLEPDELRLTDTRIFAKIEAVERAPRYAGLRIARFIPPPDDPDAAAESQKLRDEILESAVGSIFHDWRLSSTGELEYGLRLHGIHREATDTLSLPVVTTGFLQETDPQVRDGHGHELDVDLEPRWHREASRLRVRLTKRSRRGQGYRLLVHYRLVPTSGLHAVGDTYVLRLPAKAVGSIPVLHTLVLPAGCRVERVEGIDTARFTSSWQHGREHLLWLFMPGERPMVRTEPVVVWFRRDGLLTRRPPSWERVEEFVSRLLDALHGDDHRALDSLLHPSYLEQPGGIAKLHRTGQMPVPGAQRYTDWRISDITSVGPVVTAELVASWETTGLDGNGLRVDEWPLRVQLLRQGDAYSVLRLAPRSQADTGSLGEDGVYRHAALKVRLTPAENTALIRTQDELPELQVACYRADEPGVRFRLLGHFDREDLPDEVIATLLTAGASSLETAVRLPGQPTGEDRSPARGRTEEWLFGESGGPWSRERWTFVTRGRRSFLLRSSAEGATREEAIARFDSAAGWFEQLAAGVVID
jgi:hypothetical protein